MHRSNLPLTLLAGLLLLVALLAGGSTRAGFLSDVILEVVACPLLVLLVVRHLSELSGKPLPGRRGALAFTIALLAVPLIQLIPVSTAADIWPRGTKAVTDGLELIAPLTARRSLSAAPEATWLAWLSLFPPVALFWAVATLGRPARRGLIAIIVLVGAASVALAVMQLAGGPTSELRFYEFTNRDEAVGFFANRNHLAAFLYCATLFAGVGALALLSELEALTRTREQSAAIFIVAMTFCLVAAMTAVQAMAKSRAGVLLHGLALLSLIALAPPAFKSAGGRSHVRKAMILIGLLSAAAIGQLLLYRFVDRFAYESLQADARLKFFGNTVEAASAFMPFGSGLGTFVHVYGAFEKPGDTIANRFANHAHNDWAELWLETGVMGIALAIVFVGGLTAQTLKVLKRPVEDGPLVDSLFQRAGLVVLGLLLLHSIVDYPIRTEAIMAVFAVAAGLQIAPPPSPHSDADPLSRAFRAGRRRRTQTTPDTSHEASPRPDALGIPATSELERSVRALPDRKWETAAPWPDEWQTRTPTQSVAPAAAVESMPPQPVAWALRAQKQPGAPDDDPDAK